MLSACLVFSENFLRILRRACLGSLRLAPIALIRTLMSRLYLLRQKLTQDHE